MKILLLVFYLNGSGTLANEVKQFKDMRACLRYEDGFLRHMAEREERVWTRCVHMETV